MEVGCGANCDCSARLEKRIFLRLLVAAYALLGVTRALHARGVIFCGVV